jgi:RHS repeat-associated protein
MAFLQSLTSPIVAGFGRTTDHRWVNHNSSTDLDRFAYAYDRNSGRLYEENMLSAANSELYHANGASAGYDSLDRLAEFRRGTLSDANSDGVADTVTTASRTQAWTLDPTGNWSSLSTDGTPQARTHDKKNELMQVGSANLAYSPKGELTTDETGQNLAYDAWGRLVSVGGQTYGYDGLFRRIKEGSTHLYYSAPWQVLEERNASGDPTTQYVWGIEYVDAMIERDRDTDANGTLDERLYPMHDANYNVTGIADTSGAVVERYLYDPYGSVTVLDANWAADGDGVSDVSWRYLHQGGRYDSSAGLYHFRFRDLDPVLGRWTREDPLGYIDRLSLYQYVRSSPIRYHDPAGLGPFTFIKDILWNLFGGDDDDDQIPSQVENVADAAADAADTVIEEVAGVGASGTVAGAAGTIAQGGGEAIAEIGGFSPCLGKKNRQEKILADFGDPNQDPLYRALYRMCECRSQRKRCDPKPCLDQLTPEERQAWDALVNPNR